MEIIDPGIILNLKKEYLFVTDLPRIALNGQWPTQVQVKLAIVPLTVPQLGKYFLFNFKPIFDYLPITPTCPRKPFLAA